MEITQSPERGFFNILDFYLKTKYSLFILKFGECMGLDMFLYAKSKDEQESKEVCYWRKANAIHAWFVDNVQGGNDDNDYYIVTRETLRELLCVLKSVQEDNSIAPDKLPTRGGFFFGNIDYGEYYFDMINDNIKKLQSILQDATLKNATFCYHASW